MTYKGKLMQDHPEFVSDDYTGGCKGCPSEYYPEAGVPFDHFCGEEETCAKCWNREADSTDDAPQEKATTTCSCDLCDDYDKFGSIVCYLPLDNGEGEAVPMNYCPKCGRRNDRER